MNLTSRSEIKSLLKKYNARPEKYLGQHFILSKKALNLVMTASEIKENDTIIEIGPGLGTLTQELTKTGTNVMAIEKDPLMVKILKETLADYKNVQIIQADARNNLPNTDIGCQVKSGKVVDKYKNYKIVANLPYNVATFLIRQLLELKKPPKLMVLMIQKEVAQRIVANPPHSNLLGISIQFYADVKIISYVPKEMFWPKPKVDAAIIKIVPKKVRIFLRSQEKQQFFRIVKAGFSQPRKQLANNISKKLNISKEIVISIFKDLSISEQVRAENLSLSQWQNLASMVIHN